MIHIIGGAGFVGTRLAQVLSAQGTRLQIFDKAARDEGFCDVTIPDSLAALPACRCCYQPCCRAP